MATGLLGRYLRTVISWLCVDASFYYGRWVLFEGQELGRVGDDFLSPRSVLISVTGMGIALLMGAGASLLGGFD